MSFMRQLSVQGTLYKKLTIILGQRTSFNTYIAITLTEQWALKGPKKDLCETI